MEKRVLVNLENCYGIKKLDFEFSFEKNKSHKTKSAIAIYASNGSMKSSFARTLFDFQNNFESSDQRFPHRKTIREINNENGDPLKPDQIYVIHPFVESFESDKISLLLATKELKARYEKIYTDIYEKKKNFISIIKKFSKIREYNVNESFILRDFNEGDIYSCLEKIEPRVKKLKSTILSDIKYKEIFNSDVESFLKNLDNKKLLTEYIERFNELIEEADFFVKDIFTHNNAYDISKYLAKNGFYEAKHEVILKSENLKCSIQSEEEFNNLIESEKKRIFDDEELIEKFEKIDTAITKKESLRNFRIFLEKNKFIIPFLINLDSLREELWLSYIKKEESSYNELLSLYISGKSEIEKIIDEAKKEITQWEEVKDKFNSRFNVPFTVEIVNREDIILKGINEPTVKFIFKDSSEEYVADRTDAMNVLSQGEKKALYLLDIIYEIEARRKKGQETIFVIDDIADSFDYMNKYAIVEYMMDISKESFFLSSNFNA
ncbi:MAG: hypothetical protein JW931_04325 [Methanomicrobiaceae archaeon]|nr:hypothetical protein [Methanomicrobiaceae archaeon]